MIKAYQTCRVCGVYVPAGFTNCDGCYHKTDKAREKGSAYLQPIFNPGGQKSILISKIA